MICYPDVVAMVAELCGMRDAYDHHAPRVSNMAAQFAEMIGLSTAEANMVYIGAALHDIGKLLVPDELLNVPRKLTRHEMAQIKVHPLEGWKITRRLGYDPIIQDIILHHHENLNGSGYPDRLQGDEISKHARIIRIVDTFDAMSNRRAYRQALQFDEIRDQMQADAGRVFDPKLLDIFFNKVVHNAR